MKTAFVNIDAYSGTKFNTIIFIHDTLEQKQIGRTEKAVFPETGSTAQGRSQEQE